MPNHEPMGKLQFYIPWGVLKETKKKLLGYLNLNDVIKKILRGYHVAYVDLCCDETTPADTAPARFNSTDGIYEYHDGTEWVVATGQVKYDTTESELQYYNGTAWVAVPAIV